MSYDLSLKQFVKLIKRIPHRIFTRSTNFSLYENTQSQTTFSKQASHGYCSFTFIKHIICQLKLSEILLVYCDRQISFGIRIKENQFSFILSILSLGYSSPQIDREEVCFSCPASVDTPIIGPLGSSSNHRDHLSLKMGLTALMLRLQELFGKRNMEACTYVADE